VAAPALPTATDRLVAGYAALAVAINVLEAGFPSPIPGVKPGLANVITLIVLCRHGWRTAAAVALLRVLVGSLMVGSFLAPGFWMSAAGATAALAALAGGAGWNRLAPRWPLSVVGLSILSAEAHMLGQFTVARTLLIPNPGLLHLLAPLLAAALLFGGVTGLAAQRVLAALERGAGTAETGCGR
jgi:heptaprenyl diphosphate synthase